MKLWMWIVLSILLLILIYIILVLFIFQKMFGRCKKEVLLTEVKNLGDTHYKPYLEVVHSVIPAFQAMDYKEVSITAEDGSILYGRYYESHGSKKTAIFFHGYHADPINNTAPYGIKLLYHDYNILMVTERAHGKSGGKYITFGIQEQEDGLRWIKFINGAYNPDSIVLFGVSMGCATIAMMSNRLPDNVKAMVLDCGFTGAKEEVDFTLKRKLKGFAYVLLPGIYLLARMNGFPLASDGARAALKNAKAPAFFLHGTKDSLVPYSMGQENYAACSTEKEFLTNECGHAINAYAAQDKLDSMLFPFLKKYVE